MVVKVDPPMRERTARGVKVVKCVRDSCLTSVFHIETRTFHSKTCSHCCSPTRLTMRRREAEDFCAAHSGRDEHDCGVLELAAGDRVGMVASGQPENGLLGVAGCQQLGQ